MTTENTENFKLTKEDENRGLQFIRSFLLPEMVRKWNYNHRSEPMVIEGEIRKLLKKKVDNQINPHTGEIYSTYQIHLPRYKIDFLNFFVSKHPKTKKIYISSQDSRGGGSLPYELETKKTNECLFVLKKGNQFVLKETEDQFGERRPKISRMEEQYAIKLISNKLIPRIVKQYNHYAVIKWGVPPLTEDYARKNFKKVNTESFTNGEAFYYVIKTASVAIEFVIEKLAFRKEFGDKVNKNHFEVGYYDFTQSGWGDLGWTKFDVEYLASTDDIDPFEYLLTHGET